VRVNEQFRILHLSDLHLGGGELRDEDMKLTVPEAERRRLVDRLRSYLRALPHQPDIVCITGDIANRGDPSGFDSFMSWVAPLVDDGVLPEPGRFLITPGNHDVSRALSSPAARFTRFCDVARAFPHAYVPGLDPPQQPHFALGTGLQGGLVTDEKLGKITVVKSEPYLYDPDSRVLVYAFNSSLACGVYPDESQHLLDGIDRAIGLAGSDSALTRSLAELRESAATNLLLDAGLVGDSQLEYFEGIMSSMKAALGTAWHQVTKLAILHHHVNPIWRQQLELKPFESIIDAAQVKRALTEFGFDMVLHGHKHQNGVSVDATVVPTSAGRSPDPIAIVSGGTVCGHPALNDRQTFKVVLLDRSRRRESAVVEEYPLLDTADYGTTMRKERRVYQLPLADRIPDLHDDSSLKTLLDKKLLAEGISDLPGAVAHTIGGETVLSGNSDLVSEHARYRFATIRETATECIVVDVFLSSSRLDFRQRARIHWMLADVRHLREVTAKPTRVRVVIGNVADTSFSREREVGEISSSIKDLRHAFAPAVEAGLLEIVERPVTQSDIDDLDQTIPAASRRSY
jgi:3',5'-cyclic AMP phosphodiesterase CpdA